jgi:hypothetical protein
MDVTLAEFGLDKYMGNDFYDIGLVDDYNLPMKIEPISGSFKRVLSVMRNTTIRLE